MSDSKPSPNISSILSLLRHSPTWTRSSNIQAAATSYALAFTGASLETLPFLFPLPSGGAAGGGFLCFTAFTHVMLVALWAESEGLVLISAPQELSQEGADKSMG